MQKPHRFISSPLDRAASYLVAKPKAEGKFMRLLAVIFFGITSCQDRNIQRVSLENVNLKRRKRKKTHYLI